MLCFAFLTGKQAVPKTEAKMLFCLLQAFLEMASEEAAVTMVNYYTPVTPHLRSQPVFIQYSNHRELKTDNLPNQAVSINVIYKNSFKNT